MKNLTKKEIAWLAGLFEGEGSFGKNERNKSRYKNSTSPSAPFMKIVMTDEDIIKRVVKLLDRPYFSPKRLMVTKKKVFICHIGDRTTLKLVLLKTFPHMGKRRKEKIFPCLVLLNQHIFWCKKRKERRKTKQKTKRETP